MGERQRGHRGAEQGPLIGQEGWVDLLQGGGAEGPWGPWGEQWGLWGEPWEL